MDAPNVSHQNKYTWYNIETLFKKIWLSVRAAVQLKSEMMCGGLFGGGAFRNSRPLVLVAYLLTADPKVLLAFYSPIFWSFSKSTSKEEYQENLLFLADALLTKLRARNVSTLYEAIQQLYEMNLPLSFDDRDLVLSTFNYPSLQTEIKAELRRRKVNNEWFPERGARTGSGSPAPGTEATRRETDSAGILAGPDGV